MQRPVIDRMRRASVPARTVGNAIKPCIGFAQASAGMLYSSVCTDAVWWMTWLGWRRRTRQAAISPGEAHASVDPGISEWVITYGDCRKASL